MWTISQEFLTNTYKNETTNLKPDPQRSDWKELKEDARACALQPESNLHLKWDPRNEYLLIGTPVVLEQFDLLARRAAPRLGYFGAHHSVCLLEHLRVDSAAFEKDKDSEFENSWMIDSVFDALANLFMKYQTMREHASECVHPAGADRDAIIAEIRQKIKAALARTDMQEAVTLAVTLQKAQGLKASKASIRRAASVHHTEFYATMRRENPPGSAPYERIERVLNAL